MRDGAVKLVPDCAEPVIGPAASGRTRWLHPGDDGYDCLQ
jgi:hypothetical protein